MTDKIKHNSLLKNQLKETAIGIVKRLKENGFRALFAGGCVRDMLMGSIPEDYDIATDARPDDIIKTFKRTVPIGVHYGVMLVMENNFDFEVASFRSDGIYTDGRHPDSVTFCDAKGDALRRDFTINGMFYDPLEGKHFDYVGGEDDLKAGLVRAIGDPFERFDEDRLRMIRAVRFACRFNFKIENRTAEAIKNLHDKIVSVSMERIRDELRKTLTGPNPDKGIKMLDDLKLLNEILPEVTSMKGVRQPENFHPEGDVFIHTLLTLSKLAEGRNIADMRGEYSSTSSGSGGGSVSGSWELAMAVLLHDIGKPVTFELADRIRFNNHDSVGAKMAENICERLRMSNAEKERITWLVKMHLYLRHAKEMRISKLKRLFAHEGYPELAELYKVDSLASTENLDDYNFCQKMFKELKVEEIRPEPLITGNDLIALGLEPGPIFSKILDAIKDEQLEKKITTKEEALIKAKELI
ncbi:tRNA nucleotidyltransferase/poly(A) polymerase [Candidatus Scalindua japonica]|uniref:tRNA nucleotidyltransferase/poly(A) polymerase n=1 Tax=Candidatus Scalindua japonica TaxID=1284222 RepID=A0A286U0R0_9BACT|nr:CCA tRNA nucleotidyltransferase [Candidatus Scalindua japonica]GAX61739.1 tRNA nucleotidyltransferase/poly(A) polymerase [Candidatus Scalindua japonica]